MPVLAIISAIGARPVETIEVFLDGIEELSAGDDGVWHLADFLTRVCVQVNRHRTVVF